MDERVAEGFLVRKRRYGEVFQTSDVIFENTDGGKVVWDDGGRNERDTVAFCILASDFVQEGFL